MLGKPGPDSLFSFPLASAIDVQGIGGVFFFIGAVGFTVKNVIRGNMNERYSQPLALVGKIGRTIPVNRKGGLRFRFGFIDGGIGRAVYQEARSS